VSKFFLQLDKFIQTKGLLKPEEKLLMTVSGGVDSMLLLKYLIDRKYNVIAAHCNFGLRGEESDGDENFVKTYCYENKVVCHKKRFNTQHYAKANGISIQMAARNLRYHWFDELVKAEGYAKIITAHHKTDNAETVLLNMVRGTGLKGLEGISAISGNIIRPLLNFSRDEIEDSAKELNLKYREDSSNANDKYYRNKIRLHVLPFLKNINPAFENTIQNNAEIIHEAGAFINFFINQIKEEITVRKSLDEFVLSKNLLLQQPEPGFVLYSVLSEFGFNASTVKNIFRGLTGISGKQFLSATHRLVTHQQHLIVQPIKHEHLESIRIGKDLKNIETQHHHWNFEVLDKIEFSFAKNEIVVDYEKLTFPLTIRLWEKGDKIKPFGMIGHKKVSDVLIDHKISISDKEKIWVLVSDEKTVWITGLVMNEDFKITDSTAKGLKIQALVF